MRPCRAHFLTEQGEIGRRSLQRWGRVFLLLLAGFIAAIPPALAQSDNSSPRPYATLDRQAVTYRGPIDTTEKDFPGGTAVIGVILPMQGPQQAEGKALLAAAQVALDQEQARGLLPDGRKLALVVRDESGPWGQASSEILKLIEQDHALVLLTSANGNIAHQADQLANKISFPILTLASDSTTTETNVPWLFRLGPSDADQARAFCRRIYTELGLRKVLLIAQMDHDGRMGRAEFEKAARELKVPVPDVLEVSLSNFNSASLAEAIQAKAPEAVVVWTDAELANALLPVARKSSPSIPVFLSSKAAELGTESQTANAATAPAKQNLAESFAVMTLAARGDIARRDFEQDYRTRTGNVPGIALLQVHDAVHWIAAGLRAAGANRVLLRDYFAHDGQFHDAAAIVPFDPAGNNIEKFAIVKIVAATAPLTVP